MVDVGPGYWTDQVGRDSLQGFLLELFTFSWKDFSTAYNERRFKGSTHNDALLRFITQCTKFTHFE